MKVCIDMGHTPTSTGAVGYLNELTEDRKIGYELIAILKERGHEVINTTPPDAMGYPGEIDYRCQKANASDASLFVSVHLNAGGGTGTEVLYYDGDSTGHSYAKKVSSAVASVLGLRDRGPKGRTNEIGVIRDTDMTAILVEVCFVDSKTDADAYKKVGPKAVAEAIADAIVGKPNKKEETEMAEIDYDKLARAIWGYKNEKLEKVDAYQILRDIRDGVDKLNKALDAVKGAK